MFPWAKRASELLFNSHFSLNISPSDGNFVRGSLFFTCPEEKVVAEVGLLEARFRMKNFVHFISKKTFLQRSQQTAK